MGSASCSVPRSSMRLGRCSFGHWEISQFWQKRHSMLQPAVAIESAASDTAAVYDALEKKTAGCIRGTISNASHLGQTIVLKSMQDEKYSVEKKDKFETMQKRALRVKAVLSDAKYQDAWDVYPFNSGYFMCLRLRTVPAEKLRVHLLDNYGVGLIALGAFTKSAQFPAHIWLPSAMSAPTPASAAFGEEVKVSFQLFQIGRPSCRERV